MGWLIRTAVPLVMAGLSAQRYAALRGPMLWLALVRGVGIRAAIPVLLLLSVARWLARPRRGDRAAPTALRSPGTAADR